MYEKINSTLFTCSDYCSRKCSNVLFFCILQETTTVLPAKHKMLLRHGIQSPNSIPSCICCVPATRFCLKEAKHLMAALCYCFWSSNKPITLVPMVQGYKPIIMGFSKLEELDTRFGIMSGKPIFLTQAAKPEHGGDE